METISLASMDREDDSGIDTGSGSDTSTVYIRISLPDLKLQVSERRARRRGKVHIFSHLYQRLDRKFRTVAQK